MGSPDRSDPRLRGHRVGQHDRSMAIVQPRDSNRHADERRTVDPVRNVAVDRLALVRQGMADLLRGVVRTGSLLAQDVLPTATVFLFLMALMVRYGKAPP